MADRLSPCELLSFTSKPGYERGLLPVRHVLELRGLSALCQYDRDVFVSPKTCGPSPMNTTYSTSHEDEQLRGTEQTIEVR